MNAIKRTALIHEFEKYLTDKGYFLEKEVVFSSVMDTKRKFRADYIAGNIIIEINGGQWNGGRHNRGGKGYENDITKINLAQFNGYKVYQFTYEMLERQEYKDFL